MFDRPRLLLWRATLALDPASFSRTAQDIGLRCILPSALLAATTVLSLAAVVPAAHAEDPEAAATSEGGEASMQDYLDLQAASEPFRALADAFVLAAAGADREAVTGLISPLLRAQADDEVVAQVVDQQVLPFFADFGSMGPVTVTETSDQFGNSGFAYYCWMLPKPTTEPVEDAAAEARPFVIYVLQEGENLVVGNILVDHYVEGRHQ